MLSIVKSMQFAVTAAKMDVNQVSSFIKLFEAESYTHCTIKDSCDFWEHGLDNCSGLN